MRNFTQILKLTIGFVFLSLIVSVLIYGMVSGEIEIPFLVLWIGVGIFLFIYGFVSRRTKRTQKIEFLMVVFAGSIAGALCEIILTGEIGHRGLLTGTCLSFGLAIEGLLLHRNCRTDGVQNSSSCEDGS